MLVLIALCGCQRERRTTVNIVGQNGPEFHFRGSGTLAYFAVYSPSYPAQAREPNDLSQAIWLVVPKQESKPVMEGKQYYFHVDTRNAPGASGYFAIRGGKAVAVEGEHVCFGMQDGRWVRKSCDSQGK